MSETAPVVIASGGVQGLHRAAQELVAAGFAARVLPPEDCSPNQCGARFLLVVDGGEEAALAAASHLHALERRSMTPAELAAADAVVDLDAEQNECPACGAIVPGGSERCPDCGLRVGLPGDAD